MEGKVDDEETKRLKRLELNKKAAQESRKRKKIKIEELQRSVVYLTSENNGLREQNEMLRMMLSQEEPAPGGDGAAAVNKAQAENAALKLALYESVQNLAKNTAQNRIGADAAAAAAAAGIPAGLPGGVPGAPGLMPNQQAGLMALLGRAGAPAPGVPGLGAPNAAAQNALIAQLAAAQAAGGLAPPPAAVPIAPAVAPLPPAAL